MALKSMDETITAAIRRMDRTGDPTRVLSLVASGILPIDAPVAEEARRLMLSRWNAQRAAEAAEAARIAECNA